MFKLRLWSSAALAMLLFSSPLAALADTGEGSIAYWTSQATIYYHSAEHCGAWTNLFTISESAAVEFGKVPCPACASGWKALYTAKRPPENAGDAFEWVANSGESGADPWETETVRSGRAAARNLDSAFAQYGMPADYAGRYINAAGGLTILLVNPTEARARQYGMLCDAGVWILSARYSYAELLEAQSKLHDQAAKWHNENPSADAQLANSDIDIPRNKVVATLSGTDAYALWRYLSGASGECVEVNTARAQTPSGAAEAEKPAVSYDAPPVSIFAHSPPSANGEQYSSFADTTRYENTLLVSHYVYWARETISANAWDLRSLPQSLYCADYDAPSAPLLIRPARNEYILALFDTGASLLVCAGDGSEYAGSRVYELGYTGENERVVFESSEALGGYVLVDGALLCHNESNVYRIDIRAQSMHPLCGFSGEIVSCGFDRGYLYVSVANWDCAEQSGIYRLRPDDGASEQLTKGTPASFAILGNYLYTYSESRAATVRMNLENRATDDIASAKYVFLQTSSYGIAAYEDAAGRNRPCGVYAFDGSAIDDLESRRVFDVDYARGEMILGDHIISCDIATGVRRITKLS